MTMENRWRVKVPDGWVPNMIPCCFVRLQGKAYAGVNRYSDKELNLKLNLSEKRVGNRNELLEQLEDTLAWRVGHETAYDQLDHYRRMASDILLGSPVRKAYDLESEDPRIRAMYGDHMGGKAFFFHVGWWRPEFP